MSCKPCFFFVNPIIKKPINKIGNKKIAMGSDYPFPLGELEPGSLVKDLNFSKEIKENLLYKNALDWLALKNALICFGIFY